MNRASLEKELQSFIDADIQKTKLLAIKTKELQQKLSQNLKLRMAHDAIMLERLQHRGEHDETEDVLNNLRQFDEDLDLEQVSFSAIPSPPNHYSVDQKN